MSSQSKVFNFGITPSDVIFINSESYQYEDMFELSIVKTPLSKDISSNSLSNVICLENSEPCITITFSCGTGENDLCTCQQAEFILVTQIGGQDPWRITPKVMADSFTCKFYPGDLDFDVNYSAMFRFSRIETTAEQGAAIASITVQNFDDVLNTVSSISIYKRYPVIIREFRAQPDHVNLGSATELRWEVEGAKKCYITEVGNVNSSGARNISIVKPSTFHLMVVNFKDETVNAECSAYVNPPVIQSFQADRTVFSKGDPVTLSWKVTSASSISIEPGIDQPLDFEGSVVVHPQGDTKYELTAVGYQEEAIVIKKSTVSLYETPWMHIGQTNPPCDTNTKWNNRIFAHDGSCLIFANKKIYLSEDGITWQEQTLTPFPLDSELTGYTTLYQDHCLYILGGKETGSGNTHAYSYHFNEAVWSKSIGMLPANDIGAAATSTPDSCLHANLLSNGGMIMGKPDNNGAWYTKYAYSLPDANAIDLAYWRGSLYLAEQSKTTGKLNIYHASDASEKKWVYLSTIKHTQGGWFLFVVYQGILYLMNSIAMWDMSTFKALPGYYPGKEVSTPPHVGAVGSYLYLISKSNDDKKGGDVWRFQE